MLGGAGLAVQELAGNLVALSTVGHFRAAMRIFDHMDFRAAIKAAQNVVALTGSRARVQRSLQRGPRGACDRAATLKNAITPSAKVPVKLAL